MDHTAESLPYTWQLVGFWATIIGTLLSLVSVGAAVVAAVQATGARDAARQARAAAIRLGRLATINDLIGDMHELQTLLISGSFDVIGVKATNLRGRVAGFKMEAYTELEGKQLTQLDNVLGQLEIIGRIAVRDPAGDGDRLARMRNGHSMAFDALSQVRGAIAARSSETSS